MSTTMPAVSEVRHAIDAMTPQFRLALPPHISAERFARVAMTAVNRAPDLLRADRASLFNAVLLAAQDGLLPDGREAALVVFAGAVQYMPMIGGLLKKIRNSGELLSIAAHVVYARDEFRYQLGDDEQIHHVPYLDGDRGAPRLVYAIAKTKDGGIYREVMTVDEVEKVRAVSRASTKGPWAQWWGEMARKTVLRRLSKRLPMSTDAEDLLHRDDEASTDLGPPPSAVDDLNARLRAAPRWPESITDDETGEETWVDSGGTYFDPAKHAWSSTTERPSVTTDGLFRARRGAKQASDPPPSDTQPSAGAEDASF
jgi:recombination protein RecT